MAHPGESTHHVGGRASHWSTDRFRLLVVSGPDAGRELVSKGDEVAVGTALGNQLVLGDPSVSRHHVVLRPSPAGVSLRDLGSTNGTTVNGVRVEAAFPGSGAVLGLGHTEIRFELLGDPVVEPLAVDDWFGRVLGRSPAMRRLFGQLGRVAPATTTVLLEGETGTGKGLFAEAIHEASPRRGGPFVVVDCGSIPPSLIESELFGHERGAFTGAHAARVGAFEAAQGGTLFLDEIGELPLAMQPKLLRVLEDRTAKRVGSTQPIRLDVRVVAATNRDLREEVNRGAFRSDLYFRLNVVRLRVPPLRERREDIELLARHFFGALSGHADALPPDDLLEHLGRRDFPGNVRELRNVIERAIWVGLDDPDAGAGRAPGSAAVGLGFDPETPFRVAKERAVSSWERAWLAALLDHASGNLSAASRLARMDRSHLRELLRRHGLGDAGTREDPGPERSG